MDDQKPETADVPPTTTTNPARMELGYFDHDGRWVVVAAPPRETTRTTATRWSRHY